MKYLIVDDERLALRDTQRMLSSLIYSDRDEIYAVDNCNSALSLVREKKIYVAFLDVDMPDMSGLELAERIHRISPDTNIIFLTAYAQYSMDAWRLFASGFILKPAFKEDMEEALKHLRNPSIYDEEKIMVQCFGNFDVFYEGKSIDFSRTKSKEFFAYLIDRKGASVSTNEIRSVLWEESVDTEAKKTYIRSIASDIRKTFESIGFGDLLIHNRGQYAVNIKYIECDYYSYLKGVPEAVSSFHGEYMSQYSWAEQTLGQLVPLL